MIVTVCGAYRNAGDHLIGKRARDLLSAYVDDDIVVVDRKAITEKQYELFNRARAVVLCGGPAYQREIYPKVYPIERARIAPPIVPLGLGWKSSANKAPANFKFEAKAAEFIRGIHRTIETSSARDPLTVEVLANHDVGNVLMTGCPAWYDLSAFERTYTFKDEIRTLVLSMPAVMQPGVYDLMAWLTRRFPKARRVASFHHGVIPSNTRAGRAVAKDFFRFSGSAMLKGWSITSLAGSLPKMERLYGSADLHVGYRVHAHLLCLSRRIPSILINEDIRGVGQAQALKSANLTIDGGNIEPIKAAVEEHFETRGAGIAGSVEIMRDTFPTMRRFLSTL